MCTIIKNTFRVFVLNLVLLLSFCPLIGQEQQKSTLKEEDFSKWGTLDLNQISNHGKWISCQMSYQNKQDTLFLVNTSTAKFYAFPKAKSPRFSKEEYFAFLTDDSKLILKNLKSGEQMEIENIKRYEIVQDGKYILTFDGAYGVKSIVTVRDFQNQIIDSIHGILDYKVSPTENELLFSRENKNINEIGIIDFKHYSKISVIKEKSIKFYNFAWHKNSLGIAFLKDTEKQSKTAVLNYYNVKERKLYSSLTSLSFSDTYPSVHPRLPLSISDDQTKVFFTENKQISSDPVNKNPIVEVWNGNDKSLYPDTQRMNANGVRMLASAWNPKSNIFLEISNFEQPERMLTGKQDYVISFNKDAYGLQEIYHPQADFFIRNINDDHKELFLQKFAIDPHQMICDPLSNKILYYSQKNWWIYNPESKTHINLTAKTDTKWDNTSEESIPHEFRVYMCAGWSSDGKKVLLYDRNDIWLADTDGKECVRLTKGREKNIVFRIDRSEYDLKKPEIFNLSRNILLKAVNNHDWSGGYYIFNIKSKEQPLVYGGKDYSRILKSTGSSFAYITQTFNSAPQIEFIKSAKATPVVLFESNKQQKRYFYGKSELFYYTDSSNQKLKGALFFPADFDPQKKYPMIVYIYDTMSKELHQYVNPSLLNREGFNITNYTLKDYFVLLPDINYKLGNTGFYALECVTEAVTEVLKKVPVDRKRIGLLGHSFGGYETNFIISHGDIFAAAVSGAGISDNIGLYFNISKNAVFKSDMWRFESQQWRMGKSLYEDIEAYILNSPIMSADKVKTPLLLWTGKEDRVVPWIQSTAYYLALRRLGTKTILLSYPKQDHSLDKLESQIDLTHRMMQWFDYFLKGEVCPWIKKGTEL